MIFQDQMTSSTDIWSQTALSSRRSLPSQRSTSRRHVPKLDMFQATPRSPPPQYDDSRRTSVLTQAGSTGRSMWSSRRASTDNLQRTQHNVRIRSLVSQSGAEMEIVTHERLHEVIGSRRNTDASKYDNIEISELDNT